MTTPPRPDPSTAPASTGSGHLPERRDSLWQLVAGPSAWALHFLLSYITAAVFCARAAGPWVPLGSARTALWAYTAIALVFIAAFGWRSLRRHRWGSAELPHDDDTPGDRHRFLGFASLLLCGLSFVAVVYSAMAIAVFGTCR